MVGLLNPESFPVCFTQAVGLGDQHMQMADKRTWLRKNGKHALETYSTPRLTILNFESEEPLARGEI